MNDTIYFASATSLAEHIRSGKLSPVDVIETFLERIDEVNPTINAFVTLLDDEARSAAREAERAIADGENLGPLHGVPAAVKDLYAFKKGVPNTFGSVPFASYVPDRDAPLVERLERAGAIIIGKTNTPEFGHKGDTVNELVGQTVNPFSHDHSPGGSSGGSAAAVAAGMVPLAQGSDHAGSIRNPASACHLYGFFPSVGRVPQAFQPDAFKYHLPYVGSGPLTRTVEDAALMLDVIAGPHPYDPTVALQADRPFQESVHRSIDDLTVGYAPNFRGLPIDPVVRTITEDAIEAFSKVGAAVLELSVDFEEWDRLHEALVTGLKVIFAETATNLRDETGIDLLDHRETVAPPVLERIERGGRISALAYRRCNVIRTEFYRVIADLFTTIDLLVMPTLVTPPSAVGCYPPTEADGQPLPSAHGSILTWPFNLTGNPAASIPAGLTDDGLPVGLQVVGPRFGDALVLSASAAFERTRPWIDTYPRD